MKNRNSWLIEELNFKHNFGINCMKEEFLNELKDDKISDGKIIESIHNYEITSNNKYAQMF